MDIPESAIRPFEPHGIPKLRVLPYESVEDALAEAFDTMNEHGKISDRPLTTDAIELFLLQCLQDSGVDDFINISIDIPVLDGDVCRVKIHYMMSDGKRYKHYNSVRSNVGFSVSRR